MTESKEVSVTGPRGSILQVGFWAAMVAFLGAVGYVISALLQITNAIGASADFAIGYATSLMIATPFLLALLALHYTVSEEKRFWTNAAVALAVIYTAYVSINYVVQLATVLPAGYTWSFSNQAGTPGPLGVLNQTPHSLFWDLDGLGYIFASLAAVFAFPAFEKSGSEKWVRWFFLANAIDVPCLAVTYFYPGYSVVQLLFASPWGIIAPGTYLLLARFFRGNLAA